MASLAVKCTDRLRARPIVVLAATLCLSSARAFPQSATECPRNRGDLKVSDACADLSGVLPQGVLPLELTRIASNAPFYATFQSHNQRVVQNEFGIFLTYLDKVEPVAGRCPRFPEPPCYDSPYRWKLVRSIDAGRTFSTVYEATSDTRAPSLETDAAGNLYLFVMDYAPGRDDAFLYRFLSARDFRSPEITRIPHAAGGKYASFLDADRGRLYFINNNGPAQDFYDFDLHGTLVRSVDLLRNGPLAVLQYPLLAMDGPTVYAAWTTSRIDRFLYWDIHFMASDDGGMTWRKGDRTSLDLPVVADDAGQADSLVLGDEYGSHNWLANIAAQGGYLHFMYESQRSPKRQHYVRFDPRRGVVDLNLHPTWQGEELAIGSLDGFFASDPNSIAGPLYAVSTDRTTGGPSRIVVLASADSGRTWADYAASPTFLRPYSIGGARIARAGGDLIGVFTNLLQSGDTADANVNEVWFFRVRVRP